MVAAIAPLVGGAYCLVGLFYSTMATLGGQGRPLPYKVAVDGRCSEAEREAEERRRRAKVAATRCLSQELFLASDTD